MHGTKVKEKKHSEVVIHNSFCCRCCILSQVHGQHLVLKCDKALVNKCQNMCLQCVATECHTKKIIQFKTITSKTYECLIL